MTSRIPGSQRRFTRLLRVFTWATLIVCADRSADAAEQVRFEVSETAGIRRFGYPVSWQFTLPRAMPDSTSFRLSEGDRVVTAQFRPVLYDGNSDAWWLNLNVNLLPYESRDYVIEYGEGVEAPQEPKRGMRVERVEGELLISNAPYLTFTVPEDLRGLLRSLKTRSSEFLEQDSAGLVLRSGDAVYALGAVGADAPSLTARVTKEGPLSIALRITGRQRLGDVASVETVVDLEFVNSKSWVRVDWSVADPAGVVSALGADLNLALELASRGKPTLVDFGAGALVYTTLRPGQSARLEAGDSKVNDAGAGLSPAHRGWRVLRGPTGMLQPFVTSSRVNAQISSLEGWAHVMDDQRCTAVAIGDFAREGHDWIEISDQGRLQIWREFAVPGDKGGQAAHVTKPGAKKLTFWLHFVPFPPHVGAATSPQSMLAPPEVRLLPADSN